MDIPPYKIENVLNSYANQFKKTFNSHPRLAGEDCRRSFSVNGKIQMVINQISEKIINEAKELAAHSPENEPSAPCRAKEKPDTDPAA